MGVSVPITKIDFVYTRFAVSEDFDQRDLNEKRLKFLEKARPSIFDNNVIEWEFHKQANGLSHEQNQELFHGFVFHFLKTEMYLGNDSTRTAFEIDYLKRMCDEMPYEEILDSTAHFSRSDGGFNSDLEKETGKGNSVSKKVNLGPEMGRLCLRHDLYLRYSISIVEF